MLVYKRNTGKNLSILQLISFCIAATCCFAFKQNSMNLGYFLFVTLIFLSIIKSENLLIFADFFVIKKYYFFGLIILSHKFNKIDNLRYRSYSQDYNTLLEWEYSDNSGTAIGCLFSLVLFFKRSTVAYREFVLEKIEFDQVSLKISVILSKKEYDILQNFIRR